MHWFFDIAGHLQAKPASFRRRYPPAIHDLPELLQLVVGGRLKYRLVLETLGEPSWCYPYWHWTLQARNTPLTNAGGVRSSVDDGRRDLCWTCLRWEVCLVFECDLWVVSWKERSHDSRLTPLWGTICCTFCIGDIRGVAITSNERGSF